jgi:hypothetical protein
MGIGKHQCHKDGCSSQAEWRMYVMLPLRTPKNLLLRAPGKSSILVCDRHKKEAAEFIFTDTNFDLLADQMQREGLGIPNPDTVQIEFARYIADNEPPVPEKLVRG